ncbi:MAG: substrate-binding domain-containing protein [Butyrivibrio sp.]|nr:substrate-binding domain-containing protein [Butyrivibrio sp.]
MFPGSIKRCIGLGVLFTVLTFATFCGGCSSKEEPQKGQQLLLGFSQLGTESAWRSGNTQDIVKKAEQNGVSLMLENANRKQDNHIAAIRRFIAYQVDVIAFSPIVEEGWENVLLEAKEAGIPVILVDRDISTKDEELISCHIGADFYNEGVMAAQYLISCHIGADFYNEGVMAAQYLIRKADRLGMESVRIVEITGTEDSTPMRQRQA